MVLAGLVFAMVKTPLKGIQEFYSWILVKRATRLQVRSFDQSSYDTWCSAEFARVVNDF